MTIGPLICLRGYAANSDLSKLFMQFATAKSLKVVEQYAPADRVYFHKIFSPGLGTLEYWIANGQYAFASRGSFTAPGKEKLEWDDEMPGRRAIRKFQIATRHLNFVKPFQLPK